MGVTSQREVRDSRISEIINAASRWIVPAILFYSTLSAGEPRALTLFSTRFLTFFGFFLHLPSLFSKKNDFTSFPSALLAPVLLFSVFLLLGVFQIFSGLNIFHIQVGSVNPYATHSSLAQLASYFVFFALCIRFVSRPENLEKLLFLLALLVSGVTIWGIAERFLGRQFFGTDNPLQDSFGPFVNPNHYSAFIGLSLPLFWNALLNRLIPHEASLSNRPAGGQPLLFWKKILNFLDSGILFLLFLIALAVAGCFLSGSRLGALLIVFSLFFQGIVFSLNHRSVLKAFGLAAGVISAAAILVILPAGLGAVFRTFGWDSLVAAWTERLQVSGDSLGIFFQYPLLGAGLGTYGFISSKWVVLSDSVTWVHAHNDYVELLAETGLAGSLLLLTAFGALIFVSLRDFSNHSLHSRSIRIQALFAVFNIAVMELADFPLKVPAVALLFSAQLALLTWRIARTDDLRSLRRSAQYSLGAIFLVAAIFFMDWTVKDYQAARLAQSVTDRIQNLEKAVQIQPSNAEYWYQLGLEYLKAKPDAPGRDSKARAVEAFRNAVHLSPTYPRYWFSLGGVEYHAGLRKQGLESLEQAADWAPHKSGYLLHLIALYLKASEESSTAEEKNLNLNKAKELSKRLNRMKTFPGEQDQRHWMGDAYEKFAGCALEWNLNRKAGP